MQATFMEESLYMKYPAAARHDLYFDEEKRGQGASGGSGMPAGGLACAGRRGAERSAPDRAGNTKQLVGFVENLFDEQYYTEVFDDQSFSGANRACSASAFALR
jgi:hypothetical protein